MVKQNDNVLLNPEESKGFGMEQTVIENDREEKKEPDERPKEIMEEKEAAETIKEEDSVCEKIPSFFLNYKDFYKEFQEFKTVEDKLAFSIDFMKNALTQNGNPQFKDFWEVRKLCLPLFKENISSPVRIKLWSDYSELSKEARHLKEILDEQSAFAVEQIDIAIQTLEEDVLHVEKQLEKTVDIEFPMKSESLLPMFNFYNEAQKELNLLNAYASRINALRKELIKTDMRIRHKNKFFQRLSETGDKVFPKRKELIKKISKQFVSDIEEFVEKNFADDDVSGSLFFFREEIKSLQSIAKILTLNTHSFTHTRAKLSECWDKVKQFEKDRKREKAQKRTVHKKNMLLVEERLKEYASDKEKSDLSHTDAHKRLNDISNFMRDLELGRDEVKLLKEALNTHRKSILNKEKQEELERQSQEREKDLLKREEFQSFKIRIEEFLKDAKDMENELILTRKDSLQEEIAKAPLLLRSDKQNLERLLKPIRDVIAEKKEKALMNMSDGDRQTLDNLKEMLNQRLEQRQEIKSQLELYRKTIGTSSLDFEKAIQYKELIGKEKKQLKKIDERIQELQEKITEIKSRIV